MFSKHYSNQLKIALNVLSSRIASGLPETSKELITSGAWVRIYGHLMKQYTSL